MSKWRAAHAKLRARTLKKKRALEIDLVIETVAPYLRKQAGAINILEFGAGSCHQARRLSTLGSVTATDPDLRPHYEEAQSEVDIVVSKMEQSPFQPNSFDLIYSNHVLEHLVDPAGALSEVRRVAKPDAVFAFAVPTRVWLLLAQPSVLLRRLFSLRRSWRLNGINAVSGLFGLGGHGEYPSFPDAFRAFSMASWRRQFEANGFEAVESRPLLVYAPSELLLPPSRQLVRLGLCSSILFVLKAARN